MKISSYKALRIRLRCTNLILEGSCDPLNHLSRRVVGSDFMVAVYHDGMKSRWTRM